MDSINNSKTILSILNIFEEGLIESLKFNKTDLNFSLECAFLAEIINNDYKKFYGVFKNCKDVYFKPWDHENITIEDLDEIVSLKLFILNAEPENEGYLKLYCNCSTNYSGGNLFIKTDNLFIYNGEFEKMSLEYLNEIALKYWYDIIGAEN